MGIPFGPGGLGVGRGVGGVGRWAGEGEEDLIQRGSPQRDVLDRDAAVVQGPHGLQQPAGAVIDRHRRSVAGEVDLGVTADGGQHAGRALEGVGVTHVHLEHVLAGQGLQRRRGAGGDHLAVVDDDDVGGELIGLLQVLGGQQDVGPGGDQLADRRPQLAAAGRVQARGGLVQQQQAGGADQAGAQVQAAAQPAGVGADQPVGVGGELELVQDRGGGRPGPLVGEPEQAADHLQVLAPGHGPLHGRVLAGQPDQLPHPRGVAQRVDAGDRQGPGVGAQQGGDGSDEGGLAGAVGAQQGDHPAGVDHQVKPGQGPGPAEALGKAASLKDRRHFRAQLLARVTSAGVLRSLQ
jgi:hypothetical protein